jgi:zinc-finger of acetyl-transferase ESCO
MICPKCGMAYVPGIPDNDKEHRKYCDLICNGPRIRTIPAGAETWHSGSEEILLVTNASPRSLRKLAHDASLCANQEVHYDGGIYHHYDPPDDRDIHIFLCRRGSRIVALLTFERRTHVWRCLWSEASTPDCTEVEDKRAMWSIGFVWVHMKHRRSGLARALFLAAKTRMRLGDDIGWYTPFSSGGEALVRHLYPTAFYVAK